MKTKLFYISAFLFFITNHSQAQTQIGSDILGSAAGDGSGAVSISADGMKIAIGARGNSGNGTNSGHIRIYGFNGSNWTQIGSDIFGDPGDGIGNPLSISSDGTTVAFSALLKGNANGEVRIFNYNGINWRQVGNPIYGVNQFEQLGYSLALSSDGKKIAIGTPFKDVNGNTWAGQVKIYGYNGSVWSQIGGSINGQYGNNQFGFCLDLSPDGSKVVIGGPVGTGRVRIFSYSGTAWIQLGGDINGETSGDNSGSAVSISSDGTKVAIGATLNDGNGTDSGHVRIYSYNGTVWSQLGGDIDGEAAGDYLGNSVSLSSDGTKVAIGADRNDGNGTDSGSVRIYSYNGSVWTQLGIDIDGEAPGDSSGNYTGVSLSADGSKIAIGAPGNDGNGNDSGHVRIYDLSMLSSDSFVLEHSSVYPNPVKNELFINLTDGLNLEKVNFYNTLGQFFKTEKKNIIDTSKLAKGVYFVEIITDKGKATKKVIVE